MGVMQRDREISEKRTELFPIHRKECSSKDEVKHMENTDKKPLYNSITYDGVSPLLETPIENIGDAKRTLGRLILAFQRGNVHSKDAKTLCYLLISFCQISKEHEFEARIDLLEKRFQENGKN